MAAGLVSHNITTASGVTFAVVSWVPDTGSPDVGAVPIARLTDGTNVAPVHGTNGLAVQIIPALPAGTNAIGKLAANSGVDIGDVDITSAVITGGAVAHDAADSDNPIKIGARARSSEITAVANNDRADLITDLVGKLITLPYANPENFVSGAITSAMTGTTSTSLIAAPGSGLRNYITQITVSNAHATQGTDVLSKTVAAAQRSTPFQQELCTGAPY
jgi:hypothetical protein